MGFFKDFKEDFNDAMDELMPGAETSEKKDVTTKIDSELDVENELSKLDGLLEQVSKKIDNDEDLIMVSNTVEPDAEEEKMETNQIMPEATANQSATPSATVSPEPEFVATASVQTTVSDENAIITKGMTVRGNLESTGSVEVQGAVLGNISCNGKLVVTGAINGNSASSEFFADAAKIEGEVSTTGTAKIGVGSVIIGNISATSAVIAGAVKGDIDVQGPVVVDTSAVVMGNIKSRSVQINNGAVIEGFCSQCYAEVDVEKLFS